MSQPIQMVRCSLPMTRLARAAVAVLAVVALSACASKDEPRCLTNADCPRGACVAGDCQLEDDDTGGQGDTLSDAPDNGGEDVLPDADTQGDGHEDAEAGPDVPVDADPDATVDVDLDVDPDGDADVDPDGGCDLRNACGGCSVLEVAPGEPCGSCALDEYVCEGTDAVLCSGDTACNEPGVTMSAVAEVTLTSARFDGSVPSFGEYETATAHGFCWSSRGTPSPIAGGTVCEDLGPLAEPGSFWFVADALTPGALWRVRAFVDFDGDLLLSNELSFWTPPTQVTGLVADAGVAPNVVNVSWSSIEGAAGYRVYRNRPGDETPELLADVEDAWFADTTVQPAGAPVLPDVGLRVSRDLPGEVVMEWDAAQTSAGPWYVYTVVAYNDGGDAIVSDPATGYSAAYPVQFYEVRIGDSTWNRLDASELRFVDTTPPAGTIVAGAARASDGESGAFVALSVAGVTATPGLLRPYGLRAISAAGTSDELVRDGQSAVGPLSYQWQRTATDSSTGTYTALPGATSASFEDTTAPAPSTLNPGAGRWYRVVVSAAGVSPATSASDRGYRDNVGPAISTLETTGITASQATLRGQVGGPSLLESVSQHGFCYGASPQPGISDGASTCVELGASDYNRQYDYVATGLEAGRVYHVRAYARDGSGLAYGGNVSFVTVPGQPIGVNATDGTSASAVTVAWTPVMGATSYDVFRGGTRIATGVAASPYLDAEAPAGAPPAGTSLGLVASQGTFAEYVRLTWSLTAAGTPGASAAYTVAARNSSGTSPQSAVDTGYRAAPPVTGYQVLVSGGATFDVGSTGVYDDATAPAGRIEPGAVEVSQGTDLYAVLGELYRESKEDGANVSYRLRATTELGPGTTSASFTGRRGVGPLRYQWYRLLDSGIGVFAQIDGATQAALVDTTAPWAPEAASYLVEISAMGAETVRTDSARGWRQRPSVVSIQGGRAHTCMLLNNGEVRCFGDNQYGQLGLGYGGNVGDTRSGLPPEPVLLGGRATTLSVGGDHACAALDKGGVRCWGRNNRGQLGTGDTNNRGLTAASMPPPEVLSRAASLAAGSFHTCAASNGEVFCWGDNTHGQLGTTAGSSIESTPRAVPTLTGVYTFVAAGGRHTWAAGPVAPYTCWGANDYGQCLRGTSEDVVSPRNDGFPSGNVVALATGGDSACAILASGPVQSLRTLHCWGRNDSGQLGYGSTLGYGRVRGQDTPPSAVSFSTGGSAVRSVAVGTRHVCARTGTQSSGSLFCWGEGDNGRTGRNTTTDYGTLPAHSPLQPNLTSGAFPAIGAGDAHSCLVTVAGDTYACWGAGASGRLGSGDTQDLGDNDREFPVSDQPAFYP